VPYQDQQPLQGKHPFNHDMVTLTAIKLQHNQVVAQGKSTIQSPLLSRRKEGLLHLLKVEESLARQQDETVMSTKYLKMKYLSKIK